MLDDHRDELVRAVVAEHEEPAVGRDVLEHDVHDLLQDLFHRPHSDQRLRDLGQDLEDPVRLLDVLDVSVGGRLLLRQAHRFALAGIGEELAQLADAANDRARLFGEGLGLVEHDLALEGLAEGDLELAEEDPVAVLEGGFHHGHAVDLGAVLGLEVLDPHALLVGDEPGVGARDAEVLEDDLAIGRATDGDFALGERVGLRGVSVLIDEPVHSGSPLAARPPRCGP